MSNFSGSHHVAHPLFFILYSHDVVISSLSDYRLAIVDVHTFGIRHSVELPSVNGVPTLMCFIIEHLAIIVYMDARRYTLYGRDDEFHILIVHGQQIFTLWNTESWRTIKRKR